MLTFQLAKVGFISFKGCLFLGPKIVTNETGQKINSLLNDFTVVTFSLLKYLLILINKRKVSYFTMIQLFAHYLWNYTGILMQMMHCDWRRFRTPSPIVVFLSLS